MNGPPVVPDLQVEPDADAVAVAAAHLLVDRITQAQAKRGSASIVLTGGGVGTATLRALSDGPGRTAVDWRAVDLWWGDERFLTDGDPQRNDTGARAALLDRVDVDWTRVHRMAGPDGPDGNDPEAAARRYAEQLLAAGGGSVPVFDVLMLGVGPEGHVASIFPDSPAAADQRVVCAVRDCPKPPPVRLSMTFSTLNSADEVWLLTAGEAKADAVRRALAGAAARELPAAGVAGRRATRWMLDEASARQLAPRPRG